MNRITLTALTLLSALGLGGCLVIDDTGYLYPYDECVSTSECDDRTACYGVTANGVSTSMCTTSCYDGSDCPLDSRGYRGECISFDSGRNFTCFESCLTDTDCAYGWRCDYAGAGRTRICLPY